MARLLFLAVFGVLLTQSNAQDVIGWWRWTWGNTHNGPAGCNTGIAFSGEVDPKAAISESNAVKSSLPGAKWIDLGGGDASGSWTSQHLNDINTMLQNGSFAGWAGLAYDVEEGNSGLGTLFNTSFQIAKKMGFKVIVTISHSAPYGFSDAAQLMNIFFASSYIDYISPQLYTSGNEKQNDYTTSQGVQWSAYQKSIARIAPSIVTASYYNDAVNYFKNQGVTLDGFIQWAN